MARTKDRYLKVLRHPYEPVVLLRKYRAAGYLRLSEDSERKQSDSIENQRYMINQYAKEQILRLSCFLKMMDLPERIFTDQDLNK